MDGLELARRVREKSPTTPVIIVTGYGPIDGGKDMTVLQKDNLFPDLLEKIKFYLGESDSLTKQDKESGTTVKTV